MPDTPPPPTTPPPPPRVPEHRTPHPERPRRKGFSVSPIALILALLVLPVWIWLAIRFNSNDIAYAVGSAGGAWVVQFSLALVLAWAAWAIFRRSRTAATTTFCCLFFLCLGGSTLRSLVEVNAERRDQRLIDATKGLESQFAGEISELREAQLAQLEEQGYADANFDIAARSADALDAQATSLGKSDAAILRVQADWLREYQAEFEPYFTKIEEYANLGGLDPTTLPTTEAINARLELVIQLDAKNETLFTYLRKSPSKQEQEMVAQGAHPARAKASVNGFAQGAHFPQQIRLRELDREVYEHSRFVLETLARFDGDWKIDPDGFLEFGPSVNEGRIAAYNDAIISIDEIANEQTELQREMLATPRP